jgi:hypothetical protein
VGVQKDIKKKRIASKSHTQTHLPTDTHNASPRTTTRTKRKTQHTDTKEDNHLSRLPACLPACSPPRAGLLPSSLSLYTPSLSLHLSTQKNLCVCVLLSPPPPPKQASSFISPRIPSPEGHTITTPPHLLLTNSLTAASAKLLVVL